MVAMRKNPLPVLRRGALVAALAGALGACTSNLVNPMVVPAGNSEGFQYGYVAGCRSGFQDAGRDGFELAGQKDAERYGREADYRAGFDRAYHACFEEEKLHPKMRGGDGRAAATRERRARRQLALDKPRAASYIKSRRRADRCSFAPVGRCVSRPISL